MSNKIANPFADPRFAPLADLLDSVLADTDLADWRRNGVASSIRKAGEWFGLDLHEIPASCAFLRRRFATLSPGAAGVSRKRLQNARSDLEFALSRYGLGRRGDYLAPLTGPWKALDAKLDSKYRKIPLSRFLRYLQFHGIAPNSVTDAHAQGFLEALEHESLCRNPRTAHQNTCRAWNRACDEIDGWPQVRLNVPVYRQRIGFPWSTFPQSFRVDVDGFFAIQSGENFLCDGPPKPLAPRTIETQRDLIRCAASALVRAGMPIEGIADLSFLCRPENVRTLLEREYERRGRKATKYMAQMAYVLRTVALYHADLPEQQRAEVVKLYRQVAARAEPASGKDQVLLRWFDDSGNVARFMAFPTQEMQVVLARKSINRPQALRFQTALMIELWTFTMLRLENFRTLRMDEHMIRRDKSMIIHIPAHQVKNREEFETELPAIVVEHLDVYREKVRPVLYSGPSPFLFPGRQGDAKSAGTVRKQVSTAMFELTGLPFHPHCFRKIGPKIYLDRRPGEYDVVRRKLGHKTTRYTFSTYTGSETRAVHRHFDEVLLDLHPEANNHDRGSVA